MTRHTRTLACTHTHIYMKHVHHTHIVLIPILSICVLSFCGPLLAPLKNSSRGAAGGGAGAKNFPGSLALAMSGPPGNYFIIRSLHVSISVCWSPFLYVHIFICTYIHVHVMVFITIMTQ